MSHFQISSGVFDTIFDSNKKIVANLKFRITPHSYVGVNGTSQLFLTVSSNGKRLRLPLKIYIDRKKWNTKTQLCNDYDLNLVINKIKTRNTRGNIPSQIIFI